MGKVRDFKFCMRNDRHSYKPKNAKVGQKGAWPMSRDILI